MWRRSAAALAIVLLWFVACTATSGGGTQTNWVTCDVDADCPTSEVCVESVCREPMKTDGGSSGATNGDGSLPPADALSCNGSPTYGFSLNMGLGSGNAIAVDSQGNIVVAGTTYPLRDQSNPWAPFPGHAFLAKLAPDGTVMWRKDFADLSADAGGATSSASSVAVDANDDILISGVLSGGVDLDGNPGQDVSGDGLFVAKFTSNGDYVWSKQFGSAGGPMTMDAAGNIVLTGGFYGQVDFGGGPLTSTGATASTPSQFSDVFVAKLAPNGDYLWSQRFGDQYMDSALGIVTDSAGNVLVVGQFEGTVDFGGGPLTTPFNVPGVFVLKLDGSGRHVWSRYPGDGSANAVAVGARGSVALTGWAEHSSVFAGIPVQDDPYGDGYVLRMDAEGNRQWALVFGDESFQAGSAVAIDPTTDDVIVSGHYEGTFLLGCAELSTPQYFGNIFLARFSATGTPVWTKSYGPDFPSQGLSALTIDSASHLIGTGSFSDTIDFGGTTLTSEGVSYGPLSQWASDTSVFVAELGL